MRIKALITAGFMGTAGAVCAQTEPLSVIDWVKRNPDQPPMTSAVLPDRWEPPARPGAISPEVAVRPLDAPAADLVGVVPSSVTGLPQDLWTRSTRSQLVAQLEALPVLRLPAAQALLFTVLLTEATEPVSAAPDAPSLVLTRATTLMRFGAHDPARKLLEQAGVTANPTLFAAYMDTTLLTGQEDRACAILAAQPHLAPSLSHRSFCAARNGDWPTAALVYDTGRSLGAIDAAHAIALDRFLHTEDFDNTAPLPRPDRMTPLLFRLHEAIGEPFPTGNLPRTYAAADLRGTSGWKSQLEAAERLALSGALPAARLLDIYSERTPAASGGVWDRVSAVQRLERALRARSQDAVAEALPRAWQAMQRADLETILAELFAQPVSRYTLQGGPAEIAIEMLLLSSGYKGAAQDAAAPAILRGLAAGDVSGLIPSTTREAAVISGFDPRNAREDLTALARNQRMGEAILRTLVLLDDGAAGDPRALTEAIASLRALGLEDTARRAALEVLLLERYG